MGRLAESIAFLRIPSLSLGIPDGGESGRGRHAGKAGKDAHPARAEAAILTSVLPHAPQEGSKTDRATLRAGLSSLPAKDAHG